MSDSESSAAEKPECEEPSMSKKDAFSATGKFQSITFSFPKETKTPFRKAKEKQIRLCVLQTLSAYFEKLQTANALEETANASETESCRLLRSTSWQ